MSDNELKRLLEEFLSDEAATEAPQPEAWPTEERPPAETGAQAIQLQTAAEISSAASSLLDLDELLALSVELIRERFGLYYVGIFLLDGAEAVLRAGTGQAGRYMMAQNHRLPVGAGSMIGWCVANGQARIALDVGQDAVRFDNPVLPETRSEMALPLHSRGHVVGAMTIQSRLPAAFGEADVAVLQIMADQLANAIDNARLFQERERRITELAIVNEIGASLATALTLDELFEAVHRQVSRLFNADNFYIATYEDGSDAWASAFHLEQGVRQSPARYSVGQGLTGHIIRTRQPVLLRSVADGIRFEREQGIEILDEVAHSWLGVPLIVSDKLVGVMAIQDYRQENLYGESDVALFSTIGAQVAGVLDNVRLLEQTRRRAREMEVINEVGRTIASLLDRDEVLRQIVDVTKERFGHYFVGIALMEGGNLVFRQGSTIGSSDRRLGGTEAGVLGGVIGGRALTVDVGQAQSLVAEAVRTRQPVLVGDVTSHPRYLAAKELPATRTELAVPILVKGDVIGALDVQGDEAFAYDQTDVALVQALANQAGVAIENARLFTEREDALAEMETLYHTSRLLASARTLGEVLTAVTETMYVAEINRAILWEVERGVSAAAEEPAVALRVVANWHSGEGKEPPPVGARFSTDTYPAANLVLASAELFVEDVEKDDRLDDATRAALLAQEARAAVVLPLWIGRRQMGVLMLLAEKPHRFSSREMRPYRSLAGQVAMVIENQQLFEETQHRAWEQTMLNEAGHALAACQDVRSVLDQVHHGVMRLLSGADAAAPSGFYATLYDAASEEITMALEVLDGEVKRPWLPIPKVGGPVEHLIRSRQPLLLADRPLERTKEMGIQAWPPLIDRTAASWLGVPIILGDQVLGTMAVFDGEREGVYTERSQELMMAVADRAALALQNVRLLSEARSALEEVQAAHRSYLRRSWQEYLRQQALLEESTFVYDQDLAVRGEREEAVAVPDFWRPEMQQMLWDGLNGSAEGAEGVPAEAGGEQATRGLAVPISLRGQTLGVLGVEGPPDGRPWTEEDRSLIETISEQLAQMLEAARLFAETQRRAERERLVGEITAKIRASTDVRDILEATAVELGRALGTSRTLVTLNVGDGQADGTQGAPERGAHGEAEDDA